MRQRGSTPGGPGSDPGPSVPSTQALDIVIVTHNMQQAARVADRTAFFTALADETTGSRSGLLVEHDLTKSIFSSPRDKRTEDCISGRFG